VGAEESAAGVTYRSKTLPGRSPSAMSIFDHHMTVLPFQKIDP
jgi:hypothetical protein